MFSNRLFSVRNTCPHCIYGMQISGHIFPKDNVFEETNIDKNEDELPRQTQRRISEIRVEKSHFLLSYLHRIDPTNNPSPNYPLCKVAEHNTFHLFNCPRLPTALDPDCLWSSPPKAAALLDQWTAALSGVQ